MVEALTPMFERILADGGHGAAELGPRRMGALLHREPGGDPRRSAADEGVSPRPRRRQNAAVVQGETGFDPQPLAVTDVFARPETPGSSTPIPRPPPTWPCCSSGSTKTPFMLDVPLAPVLGITVMAERTWSRIDPGDRQGAAGVGQAASRRGLLRDVGGAGARVDRGDEAARPHGGSRSTTPGRRPSAPSRPSSPRRGGGKLIPADVYDLAVEARDSFPGRPLTASPGL